MVVEHYFYKIKKVYTESEKRAKNVAHVQAYRARKYSATLPDTDMKLIRLIYQACPSGYEVDHIIALSEGGPHHQDNLQYLPALVNRKKNRSQNYDKTLAVRWQDLMGNEPGLSRTLHVWPDRGGTDILHQNDNGRLAEWPIASVLKTEDPKGSVSSNLTSSSK